MPLICLATKLPSSIKILWSENFGNASGSRWEAKLSRANAQCKFGYLQIMGICQIPFTKSSAFSHETSSLDIAITFDPRGQQLVLSSCLCLDKEKSRIFMTTWNITADSCNWTMVVVSFLFIFLHLIWSNHLHLPSNDHETCLIDVSNKGINFLWVFLTSSHSGNGKLRWSNSSKTALTVPCQKNNLAVIALVQFVVVCCAVIRLPWFFSCGSCFDHCRWSKWSAHFLFGAICNAIIIPTNFPLLIPFLFASQRILFSHEITIFLHCKRKQGIFLFSATTRKIIEMLNQLTFTFILACIYCLHCLHSIRQSALWNMNITNCFLPIKPLSFALKAQAWFGL